jgi:hypothetical protein
MPLRFPRVSAVVADFPVHDSAVRGVLAAQESAFAMPASPAGSEFTLPRGLKAISDQFGQAGEQQWEIVLAGSVITTLPMIVVSSWPSGISSAVSRHRDARGR